jgi:glycosyltransferase involved in cell wall biosynthesis
MQAGVPDVINKPLSGPAIHVKHVINELIKLGHQIRLIAYINGKIWISEDLNYFEPIIVSRMDKGIIHQFERMVRRIQFELRLPYAALFESVRFALACRQELAGYDILYERMGWVGYGGALASHWLGIPIILEVNGDHLSEMQMLNNAPTGAQLKLSSMLTQFAINQTSHVVATGEGWRDRFINRWDIEPANVTVVENGSAFVDLLHRENLQSFLPCDDANKTIDIIYVGAFEPWHGLSILLKAVASAINHCKQIRLFLIGSGSEYGRIEQDICDLQLEAYVTLTGRIESKQIASYLTQADIGVSPYCGRAEYSGLKLLDYKAAGLATIASGRNNQPSVLEHEQTGWIVPPCDEKALCEAIIRLATDNKLRRKIGQAARNEAELYHSWQHTAIRLDKLFQQILEK